MSDPPTPCLVRHCREQAAKDTHPFCAACDVKCKKYANEVYAFRKEITFLSLLPLKPRLCEWLLDNHHFFRQYNPTHRYYHANNYRRAFLLNQMRLHPIKPGD